MKKIVSILLALSLIFAALLTGCGSKKENKTEETDTSVTETEVVVDKEEPAENVADTESDATEEHEPVTMLLAAAASLEDSFKNTLIPMFNEKYPWITIEGTYDSSGKLQTQIEEGMEASVFMSAASKQMNSLVESAMIDQSTVVDLLENEIVLIVPIDSETEIDSFDRIGEADSIALGEPESVPVGQYSQEALTNLGVWDDIKAKTSLATNVTEVLNQVAEGSADIGIVYATDAAQMPDKVKVIAKAPEGSLEKKVIYPIGILAEAPQHEAAELFVEFLQSPEAIAVFEENGFKANN